MHVSTCAGVRGHSMYHMLLVDSGPLKTLKGGEGDPQQTLKRALNKPTKPVLLSPGSPAAGG